jgi:hypothetical protein
MQVGGDPRVRSHPNSGHAGKVRAYSGFGPGRDIGSQKGFLYVDRLRQPGEAPVFNLASASRPDWRSFRTEQTGANVGHCDCCGCTTKRVWGLVHLDRDAVAAYFVGWAEQKPDHGATFDLILGKWGDSATRLDRFAVALDYRIVEASPQFMIVDARDRLSSHGDLVSAALKRSDVIGTALAPQIFAVVDAIYMGDSRLEELREWGH